MTQNPFEPWADVELAAYTDEGGTIAGKYRVERLIGVGGMGIVLSATHLALERPVAIKVMRAELAEEESVLRRFVLEAKAAAKIDSDHVCKVLDVGSLESGLPFMVMELLHGRDLGEVLEGGQGSEWSERVDWILQTCDGLAHAHVFGIVHRDLKPENLFLTRLRDGSPCVKILDFGISKQLGRRTDRSLTGPFGVVGSPRYMAPEQLLASGVDERADIWALGAILYELLTGVAAFSADSLPALCAKVMGEPPVPPRQLAAHLPAGLDAAILRCLRRDREQRFRHVAELALALAPYGSELGRRACSRIQALESRLSVRANEQPAQPEGVLPRTPTPERRRHVGALAFALALSVLGLGFFVLGMRGPGAPAVAPVPAGFSPPPVLASTAAKGAAASSGRAEVLLPNQLGPGSQELPTRPAEQQEQPAAPGAPSLAKRTGPPTPAPSDGNQPVSAASAPTAWTPQQAWDVRNFGGRQ